VRILIISFYFPPDLSACSFRTGALLKNLLESLGPQDTVRVVTTIPNRYATFKVPAPECENHERLTIERIALCEQKNGMKDQLKAFFGFAREVLRRIQSERVDVVYATSSRLGTAALGALVARRCKAKLHLDIRDLFVKNLSDMLKGPTRLILPLLRLIERWVLRAADQISVVSPGFNETLRRAGVRVPLLLRTNGIDEEFLGHDYQRSGYQPPLILYAGNIGDGQGLSQLIPAAAIRLYGRYRFRIIGSGGRQRELEQSIQAAETEIGHPLGIEILPPMTRMQLIEHYAQADILLVHLNNYPAFRLVIPSKVFEYGATGKPIVAGLSGVSADFVTCHIPNAAVFEPCDVDGFVNALGRVTIAPTDRSAFIARYGRLAIVRKLAADIIALGCKPGTEPPRDGSVATVGRPPEALQ